MFASGGYHLRDKFFIYHCDDFTMDYIENDTWQNGYHIPYQPKTPILARG